MTKIDFLPNVPTEHILRRLKMAGGNEIESGKLTSPQSSAALVIDTFGPFITTPNELPRLPNLGIEKWAISMLEIEYQVRFPWRGGRHPWLDAFIETNEEIIGIESKRFEPYRDKKIPKFSDAYDREVWGKNMTTYETMRDALKSGDVSYRYLDATQLVKHAFGLRTESLKQKKRPSLVYIYIETPHQGPVSFGAEDVKKHQAEIAHFSNWVETAEVNFIACSYESWLRKFPKSWSVHAKAVAQKYSLFIN